MRTVAMTVTVPSASFTLRAHRTVTPSASGSPFDANRYTGKVAVPSRAPKVAAEAAGNRCSQARERQARGWRVPARG